MMNKQELVTALLCRHLSEIKVGIIVKGVDDILPEEIIKAIASDKRHLYAAAIGYNEVAEYSDELYDITGSIEKAVLWRSMPATPMPSRMARTPSAAANSSGA